MLGTSKLPLVASHGIVCYKVMRKDLTSVIKEFQYVRGRPTPPVKLAVVCPHVQLHEFAHIDEGYHSYRNVPLQFFDTRVYKTFKMAIPKGTEYYENENEYVSETIVLERTVLARFWTSVAGRAKMLLARVQHSDKKLRL